MTSSNSCAFEWSSARDGRINGEPFDGRIELFRNGDVSVTTNDVAIEGEVSRTVDLYFNPLSWAPYQSPKVTAVWIPEVGEPQTSSVPFSVVKPVAETKSGHRFAATTGTADAKARATEAFAIIRREHLWRTSCIDC